LPESALIAILSIAILRKAMGMVDIFGRKKLEERISALEADLAAQKSENENLLRTLEKRDEKIKKLSAASQQASLDLKAALQRASSEVAPNQLPPASLDGPQIQTEERARGRKLDLREMDLLLERLLAMHSPREDLLTIYYSGQIPEDAALSISLKNKASAIKSSRGGIILHCPMLFSLLLVPPFPITECLLQEGAAFSVEPIQEMMETAVLLVSAHAGDTFLGVALGREGYEAEELVKSDVMGKHSKGGWSQKRFERLRQEDIKAHVDQVNESLAVLMGKYKALLRYAVLSGEESLISRISPEIGLPVVQRRFERHCEGQTKELLDEVYGFVCYRIDE
jgi:hypothetical protein